MAQLRQRYEDITRRGTEVLVIGPEGADQFAEYWQENDLPYTGLPDPDHRVLKLYGQEVSLFKLGRMPAQVVVDKQGVARFVHYGKSMQDIPEEDEIIEILDELNGVSGA